MGLYLCLFIQCMSLLLDWKLWKYRECLFIDFYILTHGRHWINNSLQNDNLKGARPQLRKETQMLWVESSQKACSPRHSLGPDSDKVSLLSYQDRRYTEPVTSFPPTNCHQFFEILEKCIVEIAAISGCSFYGASVTTFHKTKHFSSSIYNFSGIFFLKSRNSNFWELTTIYLLMV